MHRERGYQAGVRPFDAAYRSVHARGVLVRLSRRMLAFSACSPSGVRAWGGVWREGERSSGVRDSWRCTFQHGHSIR